MDNRDFANIASRLAFFSSYYRNLLRQYLPEIVRTLEVVDEELERH